MMDPKRSAITTQFFMKISSALMASGHGIRLASTGKRGSFVGDGASAIRELAGVWKEVLA
jgi:hypothetical protein